MKRWMFIVGLVWVPLAYAQKGSAPKGSVPKAESLLMRDELGAAKREIDVAIQDPKKAGRVYTWEVRAKIYRALLLMQEPGLVPLKEGAAQHAIDSYRQLMKLLRPTHPQYAAAEASIEELYSHYLATGAAAYQEDNYPEAINWFEAALYVKPDDSLSMTYASFACSSAKQYDKALVYHYQLIEKGLASENIFTRAMYTERMVNKDNEKALALIEQAIAHYPNNPTFLKERISIYTSERRLDEAKRELIATIKKLPEDPNLYLNLAAIYDNQGLEAMEAKDLEVARLRLDTAALYYQKAIAYDAENLVAHYNLGVVYINQAREYYDKARLMDYKTYQKRGEALESRAKSVAQKALPYLTRAHEIDSSDRDVVEALQQVSLLVGDKTQMQKYSNLLEQMPSDE